VGIKYLNIVGKELGIMLQVLSNYCQIGKMFSIKEHIIMKYTSVMLAGIRATTRAPNPQAAARCHAQSGGVSLS